MIPIQISLLTILQPIKVYVLDREEFAKPVIAIDLANGKTEILVVDNAKSFFEMYLGLCEKGKVKLLKYGHLNNEK